MKSVTITVHNRPEYFKQVLATLKACPFKEEYTLFIGLEPGCPQTVEIAQSIDWMPVQYRVNKVKLGVRKNPLELMTWAFSSGSIMNVYLEEDTIVSPDILKLSNWYLENNPEDKYLALSYLNYESTVPNIPPTQLVDSNRLTPLGLCIRVYSWKKWFAPNWMSDKQSRKVHGKQYWGWDWTMSAVLALSKLRTLTPLLSRTNHIGRENGTHATADFHDKTFPQIVMADRIYDEPYSVITDHLPGSTRPNGGK